MSSTAGILHSYLWKLTNQGAHIQIKEMVENKQFKSIPVWVKSTHLRLRERGRMGVFLHRFSVAMLSVVQKCLDKKCSSSGVGWYGNWCNFSWEEQDDWKEIKVKLAASLQKKNSRDKCVLGKGTVLCWFYDMTATIT